MNSGLSHATFYKTLKDKIFLDGLTCILLLSCIAQWKKRCILKFMDEVLDFLLLNTCSI